MPVRARRTLPHAPDLFSPGPQVPRAGQRGAKHPNYAVEVLYTLWGSYITPSSMGLTAASMPIIWVATGGRKSLTGVIVAAGCGALVALMLAIAEEHKLRGMLFWLMGDIDTDNYNGMAWIVLALREGKNREVRRVLEYLGLEVARLIRTSYGPFQLAGLEKGQISEVDRNDLFQFRRALGA